jgi:DNA-binding MarR family transcriptional regulator
LNTKSQRLKARIEPQPASKERLRLWLRLLSCSHLIEREIRRRFEDEFAVTLPRFDVMAALNRQPEGLTMGDISRWLRVSNGNVTGVVARLEADRLVQRQPRTNDQRVIDVRLTPEGQRVFNQLAAAHESWVDAMLGGVDPGSAGTLMELLGAVRHSIDDGLGHTEMGKRA